MVRIPVNLARSGVSMLVPGGRDRAARAGLRQQWAFMRTLIGPTAAAEIGGAAHYVHHGV
jgi:hypothetical protein